MIYITDTLSSQIHVTYPKSCIPFEKFHIVRLTIPSIDCQSIPFISKDTIKSYIIVSIYNVESINN